VNKFKRVGEKESSCGSGERKFKWLTDEQGWGGRKFIWFGEEVS